MTLKNRQICQELGSEGAACFYSQTTHEVDILQPTWDDRRVAEGWMCMRGADVADIKGEEEKLCSICNCCDVDTTENLQAFFARVTKARKRFKAHREREALEGLDLYSPDALTPQDLPPPESSLAPTPVTSEGAPYPSSAR